MALSGDEELTSVKQIIRSLVVSRSTSMDVRMLHRDYREMTGSNLPIVKFGYRDVVQFLKERCADVVVLGGLSSNPIVTPVITEKIRHIDEMVSKQKLPTNIKGRKYKRFSVHENQMVPITKSPPASKMNNISSSSVSNTWSYSREKTVKPINSPAQRNDYSNATVKNNYQDVKKQPVQNESVTATTALHGMPEPSKIDEISSTNKPKFSSFNPSSYQRSNFDSKMQRPDSVSDDVDSGHHSYSGKASKSHDTKLDRIKIQLSELIALYPQGIQHFELLKLYEMKYGCQLKIERLGFSSVMSMCHHMRDVFRVTRPREDGPWLLSDARQPEPAVSAANQRRRALPMEQCARSDDAIPEIYFDPTLYPEDSMKFSDRIQPVPVDEVKLGSQLVLRVGEVYSPSHFWVLRVGDDYDSAMEMMMDEMDVYYKGEGRHRWLPRGSIQEGQLCAARYLGEWHRALVVQRLDDDRVKVRHIDYGTVDSVPCDDLKPLLRQYGVLRAQAQRARLVAVQPTTGMPRWPLAACSHFLHLVKDKLLVGTVVDIDRAEDILYMYLTDTNEEQDKHINDELISAGYAEKQAEEETMKPQPHYRPTFTELENGDTLNYADLVVLKRHGIAVDEVNSMRQQTSTVTPRGLGALALDYHDEGTCSGDDNDSLHDTEDRTLTPESDSALTAEDEEMLRLNSITRTDRSDDAQSPVRTLPVLANNKISLHLPGRGLSDVPANVASNSKQYDTENKAHFPTYASYGNLAAPHYSAYAHNAQYQHSMYGSSQYIMPAAVPPGFNCQAQHFAPKPVTPDYAAHYVPMPPAHSPGPPAYEECSRADFTRSISPANQFDRYASSSNLSTVSLPSQPYRYAGPGFSPLGVSRNSSAAFSPGSLPGHSASTSTVAMDSVSTVGAPESQPGTVNLGPDQLAILETLMKSDMQMATLYLESLKIQANK